MALKKAFVYGVAVEGENFTDRVSENQTIETIFRKRPKHCSHFPSTYGQDVRHVISQVDPRIVPMVYLDIYDCRTEYNFYNKLAVATLKQTAGKGELILRNVKEFLSRLTPRISFGAVPASDMSVSLDITPKDYTPEEILQLPEKIAQKTGKTPSSLH